MKAALFRITVGQMEELLARHADLSPEAFAVMLRSGRNTPELFAGFAGEDWLGLVGLSPPTLLSDSAYLWLYPGADIARHKIGFARLARDFISRSGARFPIILGHCEDARSMRWLQTLGAKFGQPHGSFVPFEIRQ